MSNNAKWIDSVKDRVLRAAERDRIVNVPVIAVELSTAHPEASLIEIERAVLGFADLSGVGIVFDRGQEPIAITRGVVVEFVDEDGDEIVDQLREEFGETQRRFLPEDTG